MPTTYKVLGQQVVGSTRTFNTINNKAITTNVATLTTGSAHGYAVGDIVVVQGVDATFDGTHVVASIPTSTTFTFMSTTATVSSAAVSPTGVVLRTHNLGGVASSNKYGTGTFVTITTGSAHGFAVNDYVRVEVGDANIDGVAKILAVPSSTTFQFAKTATSVASTGVSTGAIGRLTPSSWTTLYTVPASTAAVISTLAITNETAASAQYRIGITTSATPIIAEMLVYDGTVNANDSVTLSLGVTMGAAVKVLVMANAPEIAFSAYGSEIS